MIAAEVRPKDADGNPGDSQIVLVSTGTLKSHFQGLPWPRWLSFSPDGAYLAFTKPQVDPSSEKGGESVYGDVFLLATVGSGREIPVVQHKAHDYALGWAPDGKQLLFASDRTGSSYVYSIAIENGHPQGNPKLMRNLAPGDTPVGLSNDGSYFYGRMLPGEDIYMVNLNPKTVMS